MTMRKPPSSAISLVIRDGVLCFVTGAQTIAVLAAPTIATAAIPTTAPPLGLPMVNHSSVEQDADTLILTYAAEGWTVMDRLTPSAPGHFQVERSWCNHAPAPQTLVLNCALHHPGSADFHLLPAVSYNSNQWGGGGEPKGFYDEASAQPNLWIFGGDRTSIPACTMSASAGYAVALYAAPADATQTGCGLAPEDDGLTHWLWWPLQEQPRTYIRRDTYGPGLATSVQLEPGAVCQRTFFVSISPAEEADQGYGALLDGAWTRFYHHVPARYTPAQLWSLGVRFAKESLWVEDDEFIGFSIGLQLRGGQWVKRAHWRYEIGWCGQNAGLAAMLLQDYLWHGDEDSWRRGAAALDFWATQGRFPNGLFYTHFDHKLAGIANPDLDTCNLGHGAYQYLVAATLAEQAGRPQAHWRAMGLGVCDFFTEHALPNGKLGRLWTGDGQLKQAEGTIGCSLVWPLVKAYQMTSEPAYLQTAERAYRAYAEDDLAHLRCTAGALDTDCIDKETAFALLLPGVDLYTVTGDPYYLQQAERAAYYLASWQWHYTTDFPGAGVAGTLAYDTFGGTSVSVQHHHLDPWGALITLGWLRLGQATGNTIWQQRAAAAWRQATIGISNGALTLKGITRPVGGQDEGFYHTRWSGHPTQAPDNVSDWLVAWPTAFRLITLSHWPQWGDLT